VRAERERAGEQRTDDAPTTRPARRRMRSRRRTPQPRLKFPRRQRGGWSARAGSGDALGRGANAQASMDTPPPPPVHVRFFRTSALGTQMRGRSAARWAPGPWPACRSDAGRPSNRTLDRCRAAAGESPLSALKYDIDNQPALTWRARSRRSPATGGQSVWTAKKEVTLRDLCRSSPRASRATCITCARCNYRPANTRWSDGRGSDRGHHGTVSTPLRTSTACRASR